MYLGDSPRDFKCNNEHWSVIVQYFEMYPQIMKSKFENFHGDKKNIRNLWEELTEQLNGLGYGKKSLEKWQLVSIVIINEEFKFEHFTGNWKMEI